MLYFLSKWVLFRSSSSFLTYLVQLLYQSKLTKLKLYTTDTDCNFFNLTGIWTPKFSRLWGDLRGSTATGICGISICVTITQIITGKITHPSKYFADIALPMAKGRYIKACWRMYTVSKVPPIGVLCASWAYSNTHKHFFTNTSSWWQRGEPKCMSCFQISFETYRDNIAILISRIYL